MFHSKKLIRIISDFLALNVALFIAYWVLVNLGIEHIIKALYEQPKLRLALILINLIWFSTLFNDNPLYGRYDYVNFRKELWGVVKNYVYHILLFCLVYWLIFLRLEPYFIPFYVILLCLLLLGRYLLKKILPLLDRVETLRYITIGYSDALPTIEKTLKDTHLDKVVYCGSFGHTTAHLSQYLGGVEGIYDFLRANKVNLIIYAAEEMNLFEMRQLMNYAQLNFIQFKIIPLEIGLLADGIQMEIHDGYPMLSVKNENIARIRNRFVKRGFDIVFSLLVIVLLFSWLFPIIAIMIKLDSKGPVFFFQQRIGYRNYPFTCFKFRSMVVHEDKGLVEQAKSNDARVTKIGTILRKTNIDELPQFFNVLIGDMSIVGPRPHAVSHDILYKSTIEEYILRHYTKPGISGWAQVNGWRGPTDTKDKIIGRTESDLWYLRNWSFGLDIKIIWLTIFGKKVKENAF